MNQLTKERLKNIKVQVSLPVYLPVSVQDSVICVPVPLFHCFGMVLGSLQMPIWGAKCVFPSAGFDPAATVRAVQQEK